MRSVLAIIMLMSACGRLGYEERRAEDAGNDASPDANPVCAADTTEIMVGSSICIEIAQRGSATWTNAKASCMSLGRRLCADAEWFTGCVNATGLTSTTDDWEWLAEESGGVALKRGSGACTATSSHEIFVDPYGYRCCVVKQ